MLPWQALALQDPGPTYLPVLESGSTDA